MGFFKDLGKKVKAIDYASACYIRTKWANFNPSNGVYAWRDPNSAIYKMIKNENINYNDGVYFIT